MEGRARGPLVDWGMRGGPHVNKFEPTERNYKSSESLHYQPLTLAESAIVSVVVAFWHICVAFLPPGVTKCYVLSHSLFSPSTSPPRGISSRGDLWDPM